MILRCTAKLLKELRVQPQEVKSISESASWHANLLIIERRKCVLFTHDMTLFSVLAADLERPDFDDFGETFTQNLFETLDWEEIHEDQIQRMLDWSRSVYIGKTSSPSVISAMNNITQMLQRLLDQEGDLQPATVHEVISQLNRRPHQMLDYASPRERLLELLSAQGSA